MTKKDDLELKLLRRVHFESRGVLRFSGVDEKRFKEYFGRFKEAVYRVNDFDRDNA